MAKRPSKVVPLITTKKMFYELFQSALEERGIDPNEFKLLAMLLSERFQVYRAAQDILYTTGEFIQQVGDKKQDRLTFHPLTKVRDAAYKDIFAGLKECGLTPKSKADLQFVNNETNKAMDQIMNLLNSNDDGEQDG
ncbi:P27 family phage terminase small subunit [Aeromonas hydrophila]|uniref:P27 family phage terminase small subunit n=1 Tax=Aeromonas hydrophila TaxID=644 RepID=UPI002378906D|nr:P27 family phage terminase small subunit [Aeromonas hydrophila]ELO1557460.1 P27 family phage terminase small subunit [Aeromonas hydrophila]MDD9223468.1 hypothetical protein [Aeromonas hydrophila]